MLDLSHLPTGYGAADVQIFNLADSQWHLWSKPRGKSMCFMFLVGGGAGGGGGFSAAAGNARGGGGGGGGAPLTRALFPLVVLPDRLFVLVGAGSVGVTSGTAVVGALSYASVYPDPGVTNVVMVSGGSGPGGGQTGTGVGVGAGGAGGSIFSSTFGGFANLGIFLAVSGNAGAAGGAQSGLDGTDKIFTTGQLTMGGPGGAGTTSADFIGGAITAVANSLISDYMPAKPAAGSFDGSGGFLLRAPSAPWYSYCGLGGSASNAGVGGNGGNGGPGSGGGGGGGGTTGGRGGDGGQGFVAIICW